FCQNDVASSPSGTSIGAVMSVARTATRPIVVPGGSGNPSGIVPFFTLAPLGGLATRLPPGELASGRPLSAPPAVLMVGVFGASVAVWSLPQPASAMPAVTSRAARAAERGVITRSFGGSGLGLREHRTGWSGRTRRRVEGAGLQVEYRVRHDGTGVESLIEGDRRPVHSADGPVARTGVQRPAARAGPPGWAAGLGRRAGPPGWAAGLSRRAGPPGWVAGLAGDGQLEAGEEPGRVDGAGGLAGAHGAGVPVERLGVRVRL